ncbi:MAG: tetratricopeptide repeat protein [Candidatus Hydrogenedentes bacterium]|nr:tetratricopeptide repeat protein [Candidatus Hydrogenedentota bacterium]
MDARTRGWSFLSAVAVAVLVFTLAAAQYEAGMDGLEQYRREQGAYKEALLKGDLPGAESHLTQSQRVLGEARAAFEQAGIVDRGSVQDLLAYAEILGASQDYDLAANALKRALRQDSAEPGMWIRLGINLLKAGPASQKEGIDAVNHGLELSPQAVDEGQAHFALGKFYLQAGLADFALEHYEAGLARAPGDVEATIALAALKIRGGAIAEGSKLLDELGKAAQPYDAETRVLLRHALEDFGSLGLAFDDTFENHAAYARVLYRAARLPDAILAAQRAVVLNPQSFDTINFMGSIQMQLGNFQQAREAFTQSLAANPNQSEIAEGLKTLPPAPPESAPATPAPGAPQGAPPLLQRPQE